MKRQTPAKSCWNVILHALYPFCGVLAVNLREPLIWPSSRQPCHTSHTDRHIYLVLVQMCILIYWINVVETLLCTNTPWSHLQLINGNWLIKVGVHFPTGFLRDAQPRGQISIGIIRIQETYLSTSIKKTN